MDDICRRRRELGRLEASLNGTVDKLPALAGCVGCVVVGGCDIVSADTRVIWHRRMGLSVARQKTPAINHVVSMLSAKKFAQAEFQGRENWDHRFAGL